MSVFKVGSNKSSQNNFPSVIPTLDLDFANSKTLDPRITFTRASGGSYVGADGLIKYAGVNEPRFDHDPVTGESLGFLVEEARTNSLLQSSDLTSGWNLEGFARTANSTTAPDGTNTAVKISSTTGTFGYLKRDNVSSPAGVVTYSWYAKAAEANWFCIADIQFGTFIAYFNLATGELGTLSAGTSHSITPAGNGWYRCSVTGSNTGLSSVWGCFTVISNGYTLTPAPIGNGVHVWGPQLEAGAFPTSYIPTEGSSRTRAADTASITGKNFRDFFNTSQGTFFVEYKTTSPYNQRILAFGNSGVTTIISNEGVIGSGTYYSGIGNISGSAIDGVKVAATTSVSESAGSFDGNAAVLTGACSYYAGASSLNIISLDVGAGAPVGQNSIKRLSYYPKRLTNQQLQVLTT